MTTQDTANKEQIVAALREQNITDLDSLAEFMIEKRASLQPFEKGGLTTQGSDERTLVGGWYIYKGKIVQ